MPEISVMMAGIKILMGAMFMTMLEVSMWVKILEMMVVMEEVCMVMWVAQKWNLLLLSNNLLPITAIGSGKSKEYNMVDDCADRQFAALVLRTELISLVMWFCDTANKVFKQWIL